MGMFGRAAKERAVTQRLNSMLAPGNIDLSRRPKVPVPGGFATIRSMSAGIDGREVLMPTISDNGRMLTEQEAIDLYLKSGRHLGMFGHPDGASAYARFLSQFQGRNYEGAN